MPKIRSVSIQNFRSIRRLDFDAKDLTVLVGDNDSGKSNILRALNLFFNNETDPGCPLDLGKDFNFNVSLNRRAREVSIVLDLELPASYRQTNGDFIRWKKRWRESGLQDAREYVGLRQKRKKNGSVELIEVVIPPKSNAHSLLERVNFEYVPAIRSAEYFRQLRGRIYGVIAEVAEQSFRAKSHDFERAIEDNVRSLISDISADLNDSARLSLPNDLSGIFERLDFLSGEAGISLDSRGDGIKGRYIPLILKFIADKKRGLLVRGAQPYTFIWAYEEPESNLEFRRAQELATNFVSWARNDLTQVFVTTHSPLFFNLQEEAASLCCAFYTENADKALGTSLHGGKDRAVTLDDSMGVMPIVAPYVKKAQEEVARLQTSKQQIEDQMSSQKLPALFVEGLSDWKLIKHLLLTFRPELNRKIQVPEPPTSGAGAAYVADHVIAWGLVQRSRPVDDRRNAFGIFDKDESGARERRRLADLKLSHVKSELLKMPNHLRQAASRGLAQKIDLESYYLPNWLKYAETKRWTEFKDRRSCVSETVLKKLLNEEVTWANLVDGPWSICIELAIHPAHKIKMVDWVITQRESDLRDAFGPFLELIDEAGAFLKLS